MNGPKADSILVLVPVFNAERYLLELIPRLRTFVCDENLLMVNDGSTDASLEIIKTNRVPYISFSQNRGKGAALQAGFDHAVAGGYRSVLTIDADLQHLPEEIPRFYAADNGSRIVIGTRYIALDAMPFQRWLSNNLCSLIVSVFSSARIRDSQCGFRLIPTSVLRELSMRTVRYDFESEMLFQAGALGCPVTEVPISTVYDESPSFINPYRDTFRFIRQIWKRIWV